MYKPSDAYYKEFVTSNPSTGAAANADSLPAATANHNGSDDGSFVLSVTNLDTGRYKITGTVPSGYAKGDVVNVTVAATCSSVAGKACVDTFNVDSKRVGDLNDIAATAVVSDGAINTASGKVSEVALVDTLTTYTGNTVQTGDSFARIGSAGAGLTAVTLAADGLDGIAVETVNARQALALILDVLGSYLSGATGGAGTIVIKDPTDTDTRIRATVDQYGNRTAVTLTPPS